MRRSGIAQGGQPGPVPGRECLCVLDSESDSSSGYQTVVFGGRSDIRNHLSVLAEIRMSQTCQHPSLRNSMLRADAV